MSAVRDALIQAAILIADAIEGSATEQPAALPTPPPSGVQKKARKSPRRLPPAPATPPSDLDRLRAQRALSKAGFIKVGK